MQAWKPNRAVAVLVPRWDYAASVSKKTGALMNWGQQRTPLSLCWNQLLLSVHSEKTLSSLLLFILSLLRERCCTRSLLTGFTQLLQKTHERKTEKNMSTHSTWCVFYIWQMYYILHMWYTDSIITVKHGGEARLEARDAIWQKR